MTTNWLAAQGRLPLAFMVLSLAWLVAAMAMLWRQPDLLIQVHTHPQVIALAHAWVLGFFVSVACGAAYQLAPVALGTTLWNERHGWWHFGLQAVGVPGMVYSFWQWNMTLLGHAGTFVALGVILFAVNIWQTVRLAPRRGTVAWSLVLGGGWLLVTVLVGLLLAANRFWNFLPLNPVALLRAHAHLGLVGFFVTLLQGVGFQLVPMFTLGEVRDWRLANLGLGLSQGGLLVLAPALAWSWDWPALFAGLAITAGLSCTALALQQALKTRKKRVFDPGLQAFLRGGAVTMVAALAGAILVFPGSPWGSLPGGFSAMVYAVVAIGGGLLPAIAGMMCKIVPFLTWMRAYGPRVGREPTPAASALTHGEIERWGLALQHLAIVPLFIGTWRLHETWLTAGVWLLTIGVALFVVDMLVVLNHLRTTPAQATAPSGKPALIL